MRPPSGRQRFGASTTGVAACKLVANAMGPADSNRGADKDGAERAERPWRARLKQTDVCFQVFVCTLFFRITFLKGVLSSPKSASNSTLRPALARWDLNVVLH